MVFFFSSSLLVGGSAEGCSVFIGDCLFFFLGYWFLHRLRRVDGKITNRMNAELIFGNLVLPNVDRNGLP